MSQQQAIKANSLIDSVFMISLFSLIPIISVSNLIAGIFLTIILSIILVFYCNWRHKQIINKKEVEIRQTINLFLINNNYNYLKEIAYKYPVATFFCLQNSLSKKQILSLNFSKLEYLEFNPDYQMVECLLNFIESKEMISFEDVDKEEFLAEFLHYYADKKANLKTHKLPPEKT